ncbi:hypothetical protein D9601_17255 [Sphingomonas sp. MA1305]|uniref:hypothetical protein n=1 Tax=Sphingomonas sp. MA1305 TaxID=2479204 RepID=UPI0018DF4C72|nr:hypothetical protein [Sphingomonas sp. MA1305]MBI0477098.1 hypothetical protein [Sphingomonas sp. MA1305]
MAALALLLAGCSDRASETPADEQQLRPDHEHIYRCEDGQTAFIAFEKGGLRMRLRVATERAMVVLTARAQGRPYHGTGGSAALHGSVLRLALRDGPAVNCRRA